MVSNAEMCVTDDVFDALTSKYEDKYEVEFSDEGNAIFITNKITNQCFTLTVKHYE